MGFFSKVALISSTRMSSSSQINITRILMGQMPSYVPTNSDKALEI